MAEAAVMAAERVPGQGKTITVYRNGDFNFAGRKFVLNRRVRTLDSFLTDVTQGIKPQFGAVRQLYTPATGTRIDSLEQLQSNGVYVAGGTERFKVPAKTSYDGIRAGQQTRPSVGVRQLPPLNKQQKTVESRLRKITGPKIIHVYRNGDVFTPGVRLLLDRHTLGNFEQVLARITERIELRTGAVRRLCNMEGIDIYGLTEIENNGRYVAVGSSEAFKALPYGNPELLSPRRPGGMKTIGPRRVPYRLKPLQRTLTETVRAPARPAAPAGQDQTTDGVKRQHKPRPPAANPHRKRSVGVQPPEMLLELSSQQVASERKNLGEELSTQSTASLKTPQRFISSDVVEHPKNRALASPYASHLRKKTPQPVATPTANSSHLAELANKDNVFRVRTPEKDTHDLAATAAYYTGGDGVFRSAADEQSTIDTVAEAKDLVEERPIDLLAAEEVEEETGDDDNDGLIATQSAPGQLDNIEEMLSRVTQQQSNGVVLTGNAGFPHNKPLLARKVNGGEEESRAAGENPEENAQERDSLDEEDVEVRADSKSKPEGRGIQQSADAMQSSEELSPPAREEGILSPNNKGQHDEEQGHSSPLPLEEDGHKNGSPAVEHEESVQVEDGRKTHDLLITPYNNLPHEAGKELTHEATEDVDSPRTPIRANGDDEAFLSDT